MQPFVALITPIAPPQPGQPPGIWGGSNEPFPGWGLPPAGPGVPPQGPPPGIWGGAPIPWPTPPIYYPPGIWGPNDPRPGWGLPPAGPGRPPGTWGGSGEPFPGYGLPGAPPGTWGGSGEPFPGWGLPPPGYEPEEPPSTIVPEGKALVLLYIPGEGFKAAIIPKPGPGYTPPSGGDRPMPTG